MPLPKPLRPVTAKCVTCARRFTPGRADQRYCTPACRQRAHRARSQVADLDQQIQAARAGYWALIREKEIAHGAEGSQVVTAEAQFIDSDGNVWMHGERVGQKIRSDDCSCSHCRLGWATWGLEAAGGPWSPPARAQGSSGPDAA